MEMIHMQVRYYWGNNTKLTYPIFGACWWDVQDFRTGIFTYWLYDPFNHVSNAIGSQISGLGK